MGSSRKPSHKPPLPQTTSHTPGHRCPFGPRSSRSTLPEPCNPGSQWGVWHPPGKSESKVDTAPSRLPSGGCQHWHQTPANWLLLTAYPGVKPCVSGMLSGNVNALLKFKRRGRAHLTQPKGKQGLLMKDSLHTGLRWTSRYKLLISQNFLAVLRD